MADRWSLGVLVGLPAAAVGVLVLAGLAVYLWRLWHREPEGRDRYGVSSDRGLFRGGFLVVVALVVVVVVGTGVAEWPWSAEYHRWHTTTGTVTSVSSRLLASDTKDGGTTQRFVVELAGVGERSCDDTRCSLVKAGDVLTLSCKRAWQYAGQHGYDCAYVSVRRG